MSDLKDILFDSMQGGKGKLPEDKLMAYLEGRLSPEEQHAIEVWLTEEGMESDAIEGLKEMAPEETKKTISLINHQLNKNLSRKNRKHKQIKENPWAVVAIVIILLLIVLTFILIKTIIKK